MQQHCGPLQFFPLDLNTPVFGKLLQIQFSHSQIYSALTLIYSVALFGHSQKVLVTPFYSAFRARISALLFQRLYFIIALITDLLQACYLLIKESLLKVHWINANRVFN
jgi:hypothetical protein